MKKRAFSWRPRTILRDAKFGIDSLDHVGGTKCLNGDQKGGHAFSAEGVDIYAALASMTTSREVSNGELLCRGGASINFQRVLVGGPGVKPVGEVGLRCGILEGYGRVVVLIDRSITSNMTLVCISSSCS